mmetsp:Transcript_10271/g.12997  ORF Transcript_10271/g.12997 Transcript_10271/m.12997 type:complete len:424 (-) Transcript_10271:815-2086(-)
MSSEQPQEKASQSASLLYGDFEWPDNLFAEMYELGSVAFLVYTFGYIVDAARKISVDGKEFVGLKLEGDHNQNVAKSNIPNEDSTLKRSFTPEEVKRLIQDNEEILSAYEKTSQFRGEKLARLYESLDEMIARSESSDEERPLTLEEFDDKFQTEEPVYGVCKDAINKRITVVFRGTNDLAFFSNWITNASVARKDVEVPEVLKGKIDAEKLKLHTGFHNYLFNKSKETEDAEETTKFDQICVDVKALLAKHQDYKLYVTGHSLGGALSTIAAFYLACDETMPQPVSNISFASPRVGDKEFLNATQYLEKTKQMRILRSVNDNDSVTVVPTTGYRHVGLQVTTYKKGWFSNIRKPDIDYPNQNDSGWKRFRRRAGNSLLASLNLSYDHGEYLERIVLVKDELEKTTLNALYMDEDLVGFKIAS